jgi:hypothetical protein
MTQPKFAPISAKDEVREAYHLESPRPWRAHRPAEHGAPERFAPGRGVPGPDQGYALALAARLAGRLVLQAGEHAEDALAGAVVIAMRRAAAIGRAPVLGDLEFALELFGFLAPADDGVVARRASFRGVAHDYRRQRALAESVPDEVLGARAVPAGWASAPLR